MTLSLFTASQMFGSVINSPLVLWNLLTNETHQYNTVDGLLRGEPFFDFNKFKPGIYGVVNNTMEVLDVVLFDVHYAVDPGTEWRFVAHDEIGGHTAFDVNAARIGFNHSYWDTLLGGSLWDDNQSIWDIY